MLAVQDFGSKYWYDEHWQSNVATHGYNGQFFSSAFKNLQAAEAKVAQVFKHGDGRTSPMYSRQLNQYDTILPLAMIRKCTLLSLPALTVS